MALDKMIIDAKNSILGRLSSFAAEQALLGNKVDVINCEECVISGKKYAILNEYIRKLHRKAPAKGPYFYSRADIFVKRVIRGMLPFKRARGIAAFKRIKCYTGIPEILKNESAVRIESASADKLKNIDYLKVKDICKAVSGKIYK